MKVTMRDVRACKMCAKGARAFFKKHNLDWHDFLRNGIDCDVLEGLNDAMASKVVAHVRGQ
jgi:hypothetical protein